MFKSWASAGLFFWLEFYFFICKGFLTLLISNLKLGLLFWSYSSSYLMVRFSSSFISLLNFSSWNSTSLLRKYGSSASYFLSALSISWIILSLDSLSLISAYRVSFSEDCSFDFCTSSRICYIYNNIASFWFFISFLKEPRS